MHKLLFFGLCLLLHATCFGQSVAPVAIANGGGYFQGENASLSFTVGESVIATYHGEGAILTQGFQQTNLIITSVADQLPALQIHLFPNPTADQLQVNLPADGEELTFLLMDALGNTLTELPGSAAGTTATVDLTDYPTGTYFLRALTADRAAAKTFKIIKIK